MDRGWAKWEKGKRERKGRAGKDGGGIREWRDGGWGVRQNAIMTLLLVVSKLRLYGEVGAE